MRYDLKTVLKNEDGSDAIDNGTPQTAGLGIRRALIIDPPNVSAADKVKRFDLFTKLAMARSEEPVELTLDELETARKAIDIYPTLVYGQLLAFLNQKGN